MENSPTSSSATKDTHLKLFSDALDAHGNFDPRYTCDQDNSSPELRWESSLPECRGFALIVEDPDAPNGLFSHWVVYNIPPQIRHLPAGIPAQDSLPNGIRQGVNSMRKLGYAGPCPPQGDQAHRYIFRLFALRDVPELPNRLTREELLEGISLYVMESTELVGHFQRSIKKAG